MNMRRAVAFLFHAPGLRIFYHERLTPDLARANLLAVTATLCAILLAHRTAPEGEQMFRAVIAFVLGHVAWGAYLALRLPPSKS